MIHIITLKTFSSMAAAYDAATELYNRFKVHHKRGEKVDLFLASSGDLHAPKIELRAHYTREHENDVNWLLNEIKSL